MRFFPIPFVFCLICSALNLSAQDTEGVSAEQAKKSTEESGANGEKAKSKENPAEKEAKKKEERTGDEEEPSNLIKAGNLSFPASQQPTPLISFGQNILNKKQAQALFLADKLQGDKQYVITLIPSILYGFTDELSIFISAPVIPRARSQERHSSGAGDVSFQLEYAFYTEEFYTYYDQATLVANVTIPTGSVKKQPSTGIGANSFFLGETYSRMGINWFYFTSFGAILTTSTHDTQIGNQFLYQCGIGRRIWNSKEWLFDWMFEIDGIYSWKNKVNGLKDRNSGGNVIFVTPSLWLSSENAFFQLGIGFPVCQNLFGKQIKNDFLLAFNSGWTF